MEEDANVRILIELMQSKSITQFQKIIALNPSTPSYFLTEDFSEKIRYITNLRYYIILHRWKSFFDDCYKKMFSSHEMYLTFVMYACISELRYNQNIFEHFINVCILVKYLNDDINFQTGLDFRSSNSYISMVYFQNELKFQFSKHGGIQKLVEFIHSHRVSRKSRKKCNEKSSLRSDSCIPDEIREECFSVVPERVNPEIASNDQRSIDLANLVLSIPSIALPSLPSYTELIMILVAHRKKMKDSFQYFQANSNLNPKCIKWNRNNNALIFPDKTDPGSKELDLNKKLVDIPTKLTSNPALQKFFNEMLIPMSAIKFYSNQTSPSTTSVEIIPLLPNEHDPIARKVESKKKEMPKTVGRGRGIKATLTSETSKAASLGNSSSISDFENNYDLKHQDNIEQYENIIQAVIRYKHSKSLSNENSNNRIQMAEEAGGVLEHLKHSIKSLIEVLDKCDNK